MNKYFRVYRNSQQGKISTLDMIFAAVILILGFIGIILFSVLLSVTP